MALSTLEKMIKTENYTIYEADCFDVFPLIDDKSIDMILCDLPYGTTACKWDVVLPFDKLWEAYERIIKDNGAIVLTASQPFTSVLACSNLKLFRYEWIWEKSKASNFFHARKQPLKSHENVLIFYKKLPMYNPQKTDGKPYFRGGIKKHNGNMETMNNISNYFEHERKSEDGSRFPRTVQYFKTAEFEGKMSPTQKPVELMEYLIKTYTNEGETVLDNCMGSGTTGVACLKTNRKFIGIEKEQKYYQIALERISEQDRINNLPVPKDLFNQ